ncbi:LacI family DNA-binding transcriptional regulator [Leptothrix discophora]|uniref:LacI family DNA-binding transcriptional regulator n=1 Tax=Leptothrix discophora TaxID=89 RepID=A0ABT9G3D2_LEPDI|nr:LacI family DNA-binding transcriptional regulator [Leptothrix discophora]MDP4301004.1 LacI family DNA-binding transcriptional regulator [Leptothrix discophora]
MSATTSHHPAMVRRKRSARFIEIAAAAGVSISTVNRVLNERGSVSSETRARVVAAAKQLGVPRVLPDPRHGLTRYDVILAASPTPYFGRLELALQRSAQMLDTRIVIHRHRVDAADEAALLQAIGQPRHRRDGLMVALHDSAAVREALRAQRERGIPVVTLMSAIGAPGEIDGLRYVGIDNLRAGRTAGHFIGRMTPASAGPGHVLLLTHRLSYRAHAERIEGCRQVLAGRHPHLTLAEPVECLDDADRNQLAVQQALQASRRDGLPLVAIYHSGAGSSGIARALQQARGLLPRRVTWIGHELSDDHRRWLREDLLDLAIDQDPDGQIVAGLHHLLHASGYVDDAPRDEPNDFRLFCAENLRELPPYLDGPLHAPLEKIVR